MKKFEYSMVIVVNSNVDKLFKEADLAGWENTAIIPNFEAGPDSYCAFFKREIL